jgi:hypothetical protein
MEKVGQEALGDRQVGYLRLKVQKVSTRPRPFTPLTIKI